VAEAYRSRALAPGGSEEAVVVVHCSDPRYQSHFHEFLREGLQLDRYALVAIPGGVQTLTLVEYLPKFAWSGWRWLKFLFTLTRPERVVLIAHDDCRWYLDNRFATEPQEARRRQIDDLRRIQGALRERFGALRVDLYYATLAGGRASFDALGGTPRP
jgi:hypothetical protein